MRRKAVWLLVSSVVVLALLMGSCQPAAVEEEEEKIITGEVKEEAPIEVQKEEKVEVTGEDVPQYGGVLNVLYGGIRSWDPVGPTCNNLGFLAENFWEGDYYVPREEWEFGSAYVPVEYYRGALAESWEMIDTQTFRFKLRQGIHFHNKPPVNGRELVAEDIKSFLDAFYSSPIAPRGEMPTLLDEIVVLDKYTLEFRINEPRTDAMLGALGIGPQNGTGYPYREIVEKLGEEAWKDWHNVNTTGPFLLTDYIEDSSAYLERNPGYWRNDPLHPENRLPYLDGLKLIIITDIATQLAAIRTHKVDYARGIPWDQAVSLKQTNPELNYRKILGNVGLLAMHTKKEPYTDVRVRQAMNMAVDYETIVRDYYRGNALNAYKTWPLHFEWGDVSIPVEEWPQIVRDQFEYDPEQAKKLIAEAGYPDGFNTKVECLADQVEVLLILQAYYADIGVDMEIVVLESGAFSTLKYQHLYDQMLPWSMGVPFPVWQATPGTPFDLLYYYPRMYNYPDWDDEHVNTKIEEIPLILDEDARNKEYRELAKYVMEQAPYVLPPAPYGYYFWTPWVKASVPAGYYGQHEAKYQWHIEMITRFWIDQDLKESITGQR